jgi:hypothetical protein
MANKNFRVRHGLEVDGPIEATNLTLSGDLTVNGNTTVLNTQTVTIEDNILTLNSTVTGSPTTDAGIEVERGTSTNAALNWNETTDKWEQNRGGTTTVIAVSTDELAEGSTNKYFSNTLARGSVSVTDTGGDGSLAYDNSTGVFTYTGPSASEVRAHFSGGTGVTITNGSIAIGQSVGTGDSPSFLGATAGNITVGVATDNTIASTNTNGNITVAPNGTGLLVVSTATDTDLVDNTRVLGLLESTTNTNGAYTFPAQFLATITSGSGVTSASSVGGLDGYSAGSIMTHYFADTRAGSNTAPAFTFQGANGNSNPSATIPWTGVAGTAASAQSANGIMGALNFSTYATTDWASYISGMNQGGGFNVTHPLQIQGYLTETPADGTLTISGATITAVSRVSVAFANVQVTGTRGQISFNSTTPAVGNAVAVTGTNSGTSTGIVAGTYYVIATNGSTTAQLSATPGGYPITTTAGTTTGLTLTRQFITVTYSTQTNIPFGLNAKIAISGFTNVTSGTYMAQGTSTTTQVLIGAPSSGVPALSGSQSISTPTVTAAGAGFRVRGMGAATPMNSGNRVNFIDHTAATATYRSDSFTWAGGAYGGTGATMATLDSSGNLALTGDLRVNGNDIRSSDNTSQIVMSAAGATLELRGNNIQLENAAGSALTSAGVSYTRTYGEFAYANAAGFAIAAQNTIYEMPLDTTLVNSGVTISNTSRININVSGFYKIFMSLQSTLTVSNQAGQFDFWLRKNGVDVANSKTQVDLLKDQKTVTSMHWLVESDGNDYWEIVYVGTTANFADIDFPTIAATTTPYVSPLAPALLVNVIPVGM